MKKVLSSIFNRAKPLMKNMWTKLKTNKNLQRWGNRAINFAIDGATKAINDKTKNKYSGILNTGNLMAKGYLQKGAQKLINRGEKLIDA